jgi:hypothetical protein
MHSRDWYVAAVSQMGRPRGSDTTPSRHAHLVQRVWTGGCLCGAPRENVVVDTPDLCAFSSHDDASKARKHFEKLKVEGVLIIAEVVGIADNSLYSLYIRTM